MDRYLHDMGKGRSPNGGFTRRILALAALLLAATGSYALSKDAETCLACHSEGIGPPVANLSVMDRTPHSFLDCTTCHAGASELPHNPATIEAVCSTCHTADDEVYQKSVHGRAVTAGQKPGATCTACHGDPHTILPASDPDSAVYHANLPVTCGECHSKGKLPEYKNLSINNAFDLYTDSIHGEATMKSGLLVSANCSDCHGSHDIHPKSDPKSAVYRTNVPDNCGACHVTVVRDWKASAHGKATDEGVETAPVCSDCHASHSVVRVDQAKAFNALINECGTCHAAEFKTYRDSFHGKVVRLGDISVAKCSDCHGAHMVLSSSDTRSPTSPEKLLGTCQKCHPAATQSFTEYKVHAEYKDASQYPQLHLIYVFMTVLLLGVFGFFGLHTLLWLAHSLRTGKGRKNRNSKEGDDAR